MNAIAARWCAWLACAGLIWLEAGCATHSETAWAGRIGIYTFDQAVVELGPPDKQAKLTDGTVVAEWLTQQGYAYAYPSFNYYNYPWYHGPYYPAFSGGYSPNYYLRLAFGPDGKLQSWKKFAR